jgi:uncharacterized membrane protein HdeD (DUF308 family)
MSTVPAAVPQNVSTRSMVWAILLTIIGFLALVLPVVSSIGIVMIIAWVVIFSSVFQFVYAFHSSGIGSILWKLLVAVVYFIAGVYLVTHPVLGVASLTLVLAAFFVAEAVMDFIGYFHGRAAGASGWILVDGVITLVLGVLIWMQWPSSSLWVIGTLVGISLIMTGTTRLMMCLAARQR